jgi:TolB protein
MLRRGRYPAAFLGAVLAVVLSVATAGIATAEQCLFSRIAFSSTRDNPPPADPRVVGEIYLMDPDGTHPTRLTENTGGSNSFAAPSPDGKKIVFDSNRLRVEGEPLLTSDLFVMNTDGTEQTYLIRGSNATWSPDSKHIAFFRSASGDVCTVENPLDLPPADPGCPIRVEPGAPTWDSDIFIMNVDDRLPQNLTNSPADIDDDPDWSPDGQRIVFTSHKVNDDQTNSVTAEIYVMNADGSGPRVRLTDNDEEERGPAWSPDGTRIVFMCRKGPVNPQGLKTFRICVMNADGSGQTEQLTFHPMPVSDLTPSWSPDGQQIVFHRPVGGRPQLFLMNAGGTGQVQLTNTPTNPLPGINLIAKWGVSREPCKGDESN